MTSQASRYIALGATLMFAASCSDRPAPTAVLQVPVFERHSGDAPKHAARHLDTDLRGANEVPPHDTRAKGKAVFQVHADGSVSYKVFVEHIRNPFMAHIHLAAVGVNGPIVEWLFPGTAPTPGPIGIGVVNGLLAKGSFTAADFVGPLTNAKLADLLDAIRAGNAYVNVHTNDGTATAGPGNFPGGEIRGQLGARPGKHAHGDDEE